METNKNNYWKWDSVAQNTLFNKVKKDLRIWSNGRSTKKTFQKIWSWFEEDNGLSLAQSIIKEGFETGADERIKLLESFTFHKSNVENEATLVWVEKYGLKPSFKEGEVCSLNFGDPETQVKILDTYPELLKYKVELIETPGSFTIVKEEELSKL